MKQIIREVIRSEYNKFNDSGLDFDFCDVAASKITEQLQDFVKTKDLRTN